MLLFFYNIYYILMAGEEAMCIIFYSSKPVRIVLQF